MEFNYWDRVRRYELCDHIVQPNGYIVWRRGTGDNVELLHLRVGEKRRGTGRSLLCRMLEKLRADPPYATVFLFTKVDNADAIAFYEAMGFVGTKVSGVYDAGTAVVFSARYDDLLRRHCG